MEGACHVLSRVDKGLRGTKLHIMRRICQLSNIPLTTLNSVR